MLILHVSMLIPQPSPTSPLPPAHHPLIVPLQHRQPFQVDPHDLVPIGPHEGDRLGGKAALDSLLEAVGEVETAGCQHQAEVRLHAGAVYPLEEVVEQQGSGGLGEFLALLDREEELTA